MARYDQCYDDCTTDCGACKGAGKPAEVSNTLSSSRLREMVREYRDPSATDEEREEIRAEWQANGVPNQFAAMTRAAELDRQDAEWAWNRHVESLPPYMD